MFPTHITRDDINRLTASIGREVKARFGLTAPHEAFGAYRQTLADRLALAGALLLSRPLPIDHGDVLSAHKALFGGMVSHGGQLRTLATGRAHGPTYSTFVLPDTIGPTLDRLLPIMSMAILGARAKDLPKVLAAAYSDFNVIHPFIDGNGRMNFLVLDTLMRRRGLHLRFDRIRRGDLAAAAFFAAQGELTALVGLMQLALAEAPELRGPA